MTDRAGEDDNPMDKSGERKTESIRSFEDLKVYQKAFTLQQEIFALTKKFPTDEKYALVSQVRRSSRSVGANITEAWQKRRYVAHFVSKLSDADGEQAETRHWIGTSKACGYISVSLWEDLISRYKEVGKMLGKMMNSPDSWCRQFTT